MLCTTELLRNRYIVLELCAGTLEDVCDKEYNGPALPPDEIVLHQIACGVAHIHSKELVHRDIKPANILISLTDPVVIKIADFDHTKPTTINGSCSHSTAGTPRWYPAECFTNAPQNLRKIKNGKRRDSIKRDIFSTGLVFFYYLTRGQHLFGNMEKRWQIEDNIEKNNPVNLYSEYILRFIQISQLFFWGGKLPIIQSCTVICRTNCN